MLPGRAFFFWDPERHSHWSFWVKCVSGYWEQALRLVDKGLRVLGEKERVQPDSASPIGTGTDNEENPQ